MPAPDLITFLTPFVAKLHLGKVVLDLARKRVRKKEAQERPEALLLRLPPHVELYQWRQLSRQRQGTLANPWEDSIPRFIARQGEDFIAYEHQAKTKYIDFNRRHNPLLQVSETAGPLLNWFGIRPRAFITAGRSHFRAAVDRYLDLGGNRHLRVHTMHPGRTQPRDENVYAKNIRDETKFLLQNSDRGQFAVKLGVTSNMVLSEAALAIHRGSLVLEVDPVDPRLTSLVAVYDGLCRRLYALAEFTALMRLAAANRGRISVALLEEPLTYRGFLSNKKGAVSTVQVSMIDRPGLVYSELTTRDPSYTFRLREEARKTSRGSRLRKGKRGIGRVREELLESIRDSGPGLKSARDFPRRSKRGRIAREVLQRYESAQSESEIEGFDPWFAKNVQQRLWRRLCSDLLARELVRVRTQ